MRSELSSTPSGCSVYWITEGWRKQRWNLLSCKGCFIQGEPSARLSVCVQCFIRGEFAMSWQMEKGRCCSIQSLAIDRIIRYRSKCQRMWTGGSDHVTIRVCPICCARRRWCAVCISAISPIMTESHGMTSPLKLGQQSQHNGRPKASSKTAIL